MMHKAYRNFGGSELETFQSETETFQSEIETTGHMSI